MQISLCGKLSCGVLAQSSLPVFKSSHLLFWSQKGRKSWLHLMPQMLLLPSLHPLLSPSVSYTHGRTYPCVFDGSPCILWCCSVWCWLIAESMNIHLLWCWMRDWIWSVRRQQAIMTYKAWYRGGKSCVCMRQPCCVREAPLIVRDSHWFSLLTFIWLDIWTETQLSNIISKHTLMSHVTEASLESLGHVQCILW